MLRTKGGGRENTPYSYSAYRRKIIDGGKDVNYSALNGYEFEKYITDLLRHLGFRAQQTTLSGDGGVDIVAYNDKPLTKGLYLIQCKNWVNPVGQPVVRDLFGVVMSQRANKGILITTSYFTEQAIEFANGLNIELIDGDALNELSKSFLQTETGNRKLAKYDDYINDGCFPKERYIYLKQKAEKAKTYQSYVEYLVFLLQYTEPRYEGFVDKGLGKDIISLCDDIYNRFCKKGKNRTYRSNSMVFIKAYVLFIMGRIAESVEHMNELGLFDFDDGMDYYVPCDFRTFSKTEIELFNSNPDSTVMQFYKNGKVIYPTAAGDCYFVETSGQRQVLVLDLLLLAKQLEMDDLAAYLQNKITCREPHKRMEYQICPSIKEYTKDYCIDIISQYNKNEGDIQGRDIIHYYWFPYYFSMEKHDDDIWIRQKCYKSRAEDIQETLVNRWDNVEQIKNEVNTIVHLMGMF